MFRFLVCFCLGLHSLFNPCKGLENIYISEYKNMRTLKMGVAEYIRFYNLKRFHQSLQYQKPMEVYNQSISQQFQQAA